MSELGTISHEKKLGNHKGFPQILSTQKTNEETEVTMTSVFVFFLADRGFRLPGSYSLLDCANQAHGLPVVAVGSDLQLQSFCAEAYGIGAVSITREGR